MHRYHLAPTATLLTLALLTVCQAATGDPPTLAVSSPAAQAPVSGTVTVQASVADDASVSRVDLYTRGKGGAERGPLLSAPRRTIGHPITPQITMKATLSGRVASSAG